MNLRCGIQDYKTCAFGHSANRALKREGKGRIRTSVHLVTKVALSAETYQPIEIKRTMWSHTRIQYNASGVLSVVIALYSNNLLAHSSENALDILQKLDIMERIFGVEPN